MKEYFKHFFYLLDTPAKRTLPFLIAAFLLSSLLDVIGVGLIGVFLGLLTNPHFLSQKLPSVFSLLQGFTEKKVIVFSGLLIIIAFVMKAIITLLIQKKVIFF